MKRKGVPQFVQKPRLASSEQTYHFRCSRPASLKPSQATPNQVTTGAPCCWRQEKQWQCEHHLTGWVTTYLTSPQAQLPMAKGSTLIGFLLRNAGVDRIFVAGGGQPGEARRGQRREIVLVLPGSGRRGAGPFERPAEDLPEVDLLHVPQAQTVGGHVELAAHDAPPGEVVHPPEPRRQGAGGRGQQGALGDLDLLADQIEVVVRASREFLI